MSSIRTLLDGGHVETGGLHFIATPDTDSLMWSVKGKVQTMLNIVQWNSGSPRIITSQTFPQYEQFANGESIATLNSVRWRHVYYFSDPHGNATSINPKTGLAEPRGLNDRLMHDMLTLGALQENWARTVNLVLLDMPYGRQDKATPGKRQAASLDRVGQWLSEITGTNGYIITTDLHNPASKSSFRGTNFINLYSGWFLMQVVGEEQKAHPDLRPILLPADQGWDKKIGNIAQEYGLKYGMSIKMRDYSTTNSVDSVTVTGDIEWKDVFIHDDILDTGGTLVKLLEEVIAKNPRSISVCITHGLFNGEALAKLSSMLIKHGNIIRWVYVTDSVYRENLKEYEWIKRLSNDNIVSNTIFSIYQWLPINRWDAEDYLVGR